jgi:hypothetical protein
VVDDASVDMIATSMSGEPGLRRHRLPAGARTRERPKPPSGDAALATGSRCAPTLGDNLVRFR